MSPTYIGMRFNCNLGFTIALLLGQPVFGALSYSPAGNSDQAPLSELLLLNDSFRTVGLTPLNPQTRGQVGFGDFHQIFVNNNWNKAVFVRFGWKLSDADQNDQMLKMGPGQAYHNRLGESLFLV